VLDLLLPLALLAVGCSVGALAMRQSLMSKLLDAQRNEALAKDQAAQAIADLQLLRSKFEFLSSDFNIAQKSAASLRATIDLLNSQISQLEAQKSNLAGSLAGARARAKRKEKVSEKGNPPLKPSFGYLSTPVESNIQVL
jgi:chromosome segregation ATPase